MDRKLFVICISLAAVVTVAIATSWALLSRPLQRLTRDSVVYSLNVKNNMEGPVDVYIINTRGKYVAGASTIGAGSVADINVFSGDDRRSLVATNLIIVVTDELNIIRTQWISGRDLTGVSTNIVLDK